MGYFNFYDVDWENEGKGKFTEEEANEVITELANSFLENIRMDRWLDFVAYDNGLWDIADMNTIIDPNRSSHLVARLNLCYSGFQDVLEPLEIDYPDIFEDNIFNWGVIPDPDGEEFRKLSDETLDRITEAVDCVYRELKNQIEFITTTLPKPEEIE